MAKGALRPEDAAVSPLSPDMSLTLNLYPAETKVISHDRRKGQTILQSEIIPCFVLRYIDILVYQYQARHKFSVLSFSYFCTEKDTTASA